MSEVPKEGAEDDGDEGGSDAGKTSTAVTGRCFICCSAETAGARTAPAVPCTIVVLSPVCGKGPPPPPRLPFFFVTLLCTFRVLSPAPSESKSESSPASRYWRFPRPFSGCAIPAAAIIDHKSACSCSNSGCGSGEVSGLLVHSRKQSPWTTCRYGASAGTL